MFFWKKYREKLEKIEEIVIILYDELKVRDGVVSQQDRIIEQLTQANKDLMDRLMSQDFEKFKTFTIPEMVDEEEPYDFLQDESLAGEVYDGEETRR